MTAGLPGSDDAVALTDSSPLSGDVTLVTVGADGGDVRTVTEDDTAEHAWPLTLVTDTKQV